MKGTISNKIISSYGGAVPLYSLIEKFGIREIIREVLGERPTQSKYQYDDTIIGWLMTIYCHGYRLIKIANAKTSLSLIPSLNICSHDTVGRVLKKLATESAKIENQKRIDPSHPPKKFTFNENEKLNNLLILVTKKIGQLKEGVSYTLDLTEKGHPQLLALALNFILEFSPTIFLHEFINFFFKRLFPMMFFLLDDNSDLLIGANGDFSVGDSTLQDVESIITSYPGWWKQYPLVGCSAPSYLNSPGVGQQLSNSIKQQLKLDGKTLTSFSASMNTDGTLTINVNGQSMQVGS